MENDQFKKGIDYIGVTVSYFCHDGNGNYVLAKRSVNTRDEHGRWDTGGGSVEFGDTVINTLKKEIKEEYCTEVLDYEFLGYKDILREQEGTQTHWLSLYFKVLVEPSTVKIGEPHKFDDIGWFRLNNLPEPLHSQFLPSVEQFKDRL